MKDIIPMPLVPITATFAVSPQIQPEDVAGIKALGYVAFINNRPEGESFNQPEGHLIAAAAAEAGMAYNAIPVQGGLTLDVVEAYQNALLTAQGPVVAFCASGTRSLIVWAIGEVLAGRLAKQDVVPLGAEHGYDLSGAVAWLTHHGY